MSDDHVDVDALRDGLSRPDDDAALQALITEAVRMKRRLDKLDLLIAGDVNTWTTIVPSRGDSDVLELKMDSAAQEARQLATVFRQTLGEIARRREGGDSGEGDDDILGGLRLA